MINTLKNALSHKIFKKTVLQFNKIKGHSYYLFNPISPYRGDTPNISESNGDPLYEFSQLFATQFIEGGGFSQQVKNEPQIKKPLIDFP